MNNFREKKTKFEQKTLILQELIKVTDNFNESLPILSQIQKKQNSPIRKIIEFSKKFYNKDCIYRPFINKFSEVLKKEIDEGVKISSYFEKVDKFNIKLKKQLQPLTKEKKKLCNLLKKELHYIRKYDKLVNYENEKNLNGKKISKFQKKKKERNLNKKNNAVNLSNKAFSEYEEIFLKTVKKRFEFINPILKEFALRKGNFFIKLGEAYKKIYNDIRILDDEDNFEDYKDQIFQSRILEMEFNQSKNLSNFQFLNKNDFSQNSFLQNLNFQKIISNKLKNSLLVNLEDLPKDFQNNFSKKNFSKKKKIDFKNKKILEKEDDLKINKKDLSQILLQEKKEDLVKEKKIENFQNEIKNGRFSKK